MDDIDFGGYGCGRGGRGVRLVVRDIGVLEGISLSIPISLYG